MRVALFLRPASDSVQTHGYRSKELVPHLPHDEVGLGHMHVKGVAFGQVLDESQNAHGTGPY
jgi:hypothetical protein